MMSLNEEPTPIHSPLLISFSVRNLLLVFHGLISVILTVIHKSFIFNNLVILNFSDFHNKLILDMRNTNGRKDGSAKYTWKRRWSITVSMKR